MIVNVLRSAVLTIYCGRRGIIPQDIVMQACGYVDKYLFGVRSPTQNSKCKEQRAKYQERRAKREKLRSQKNSGDGVRAIILN